MQLLTPLIPLVKAPFALGSKLRQARVFHPRGVVRAGFMHVSGEGPLPEGRTECTVRLSKAMGTPGGSRDFLGLALRYTDGDRPVDVLLATSPGTEGLARFGLWPVGSWGAACFTSLIPWESESGTRVHVLAESRDPRLTSTDERTLDPCLPIAFDLRVASRHADVQVGQLVVTGPERPVADFDPVLHEPPGWRFVPAWLARLRLAAYDASRQARPDSVGPEPGPRLVRDETDRSSA